MCGWTVCERESRRECERNAEEIVAIKRKGGKESEGKKRENERDRQTRYPGAHSTSVQQAAGLWALSLPALSFCFSQTARTVLERDTVCPVSYRGPVESATLCLTLELSQYMIWGTADGVHF